MAVVATLLKLVSRDGAGALISAEHGITVLGVYNTLQSLGF